MFNKAGEESTWRRLVYFPFCTIDELISNFQACFWSSWLFPLPKILLVEKINRELAPYDYIFSVKQQFSFLYDFKVCTKFYLSQVKRILFFYCYLLYFIEKWMIFSVFFVKLNKIHAGCSIWSNSNFPTTKRTIPAKLAQRKGLWRHIRMEVLNIMF